MTTPLSDAALAGIREQNTAFYDPCARYIRKLLAEVDLLRAALRCGACHGTGEVAWDAKRCPTCGPTREGLGKEACPWLA